MLNSSIDNSINNSAERGAAAEDWSLPAAATDTGCERDLNEDRYAVVDSPSGLVWVVCDGMGGQTGGELAAQLVIDGIRRDLEGQPPRPLLSALRSAILESNRIIVLRRQNPAFASMGTTIVAAGISGAEVVIAHAGDSRAYLIRSQQAELLTEDHTYVQKLVHDGKILPAEAMSHPQAHVLTRAIGAEPALQLDNQRWWLWPAEKGARSVLLLCTDGLYSLVSDQEMAEIISDRTPRQACVDLVALAKKRGGFDNITLALIPLEGDLRQEMPAGYSEAEELRRRAKKRRTARRGGAGWKQFLLGMGILSLLGIVTVWLLMLFILAK